MTDVQPSPVHAEQPLNQDDRRAAAEIAAARDRIVGQLEKVIVGQKPVIEELLIALFSRGHCLLVGVPGLAKTLMVSTLASVLDLTFNRIQFTPDLMPSDITGTDILEEDSDDRPPRLRLPAGADLRQHRAGRRDQPHPAQDAGGPAAGHAGVQGHGGRPRPTLPDAVLRLATQNPIEQEGTYPLPEAQLDRFMFNVGIDYPDFEQEVQMVEATTSAYQATLERVLEAERTDGARQRRQRVCSQPRFCATLVIGLVEDEADRVQPVGEVVADHGDEDEHAGDRVEPEREPDREPVDEAVHGEAEGGGDANPLVGASLVRVVSVMQHQHALDQEEGDEAGADQPSHQLRVVDRLDALREHVEQRDGYDDPAGERHQGRH